jgi:hypothetical protein
MASGIVETSSSSSQESQQQQAQQPGQGRSKLVQRLLGSSANLPQFINDLLQTMAVVVAGTEAAGFLVERQQVQVPAETAPGGGGDDGVADGPPVSAPGGDGDDAVVPSDTPPPQSPTPPSIRVGITLRPIAHLRPDDSDADTRNAAIRAFQEIVAPCVQQGKDGAIEVGAPDAGEPQYCLVTLLRSEGMVVAAAAVITRARDLERARQRLTSMQLVAGYFDLFSLRRGADQARAVAQNHQNVLQLATAVGTAEGFESAAMNLCNELANRTGATRVSLGWLKGKTIKVRALSHTEKFDKKQELIVQIEKAMEECLDQEEPVRFDGDGTFRSQNVTRAAEQLARAQGGNSVLSLPLRRKDDVSGVITLEFAPPTKPVEPLIEALITAADMLTPSLKDRFDNDRWLIVKTGHSIQKVAGMAIGPKHMLAKLIIALVIGAAAFVTFFRPMYHVSAPFMLAAVGKQPVSIPFDGRILRIGINPRTHKMFEPGDEVRAGEVLAEMNTDELHKQLLVARSREGEACHKAAAAKAQSNQPGKLAEMRQAEFEAEGYKHEAELYEIQIDDAKMKSEFDGLIIKADELETKTNLAVHKGDILMEVARAGDLRAELAVSERDVQELREKTQHGKLATSSFPSEEFGFTIDRIVPSGDAKEGDNVFKVYATLDQSAPWMRPGMAGEAKVDVEKRRLVWIWTHRLIDFLKLKLWM